jgi:hypothetical protein
MAGLTGEARLRVIRLKALGAFGDPGDFAKVNTPARHAGLVAAEHHEP